MRQLLLALLIALALPMAAQAYTCSGSSCTPVLNYIEPSTYESGAPLTDLKDGVFNYQLNGGANQTLTIPATVPQGGKSVAASLAAQTIPVCTVGTLTGTLVMRTQAGGVSKPATVAPLTIDRTKLASGALDPACGTPNPALGPSIN